MEVHTTQVAKDPVTGETESIATRDYVPSPGVVAEAKVEQATSWVWYLVGLVNTLLVLRILFLLFGARNTGFASVLYSVTRVLEAPFRGIFVAPRVETGYFDTAALLAVVIYALIGWGVASLIEVATRPKS